MKKVLAIVGPTAVGKSSFGIKCANFFNGEIISGDSIQVYKGLDIGSGKVNKIEQAQAKHHLIDILEPTEEYNVKDFQEYARKLIEEISSNDKLPIIVGGTGLYIKAALYDYIFNEEETKDKEYEELSNLELYERLKIIDPKALEKIHVNNRKRLLRALNYYEKHGEPFSANKDNQEHKPLYDVLIIGLTVSREELYKRIDLRIDKMVEDGLINEIETLLNKGITFNSRSMQGIGYKELRPYFENNKSLEECIDDIKRNSHHFAKRQYTFFNNQLDVKWFENIDDAIKEVESWLI